MRVVYADGEIEIDFLARIIVKNTTERVLKPLELHDPLGDAVAGFVAAARAGASALVRPEEAHRALETALLIEETLVPAIAVQAQKHARLRRTARSFRGSGFRQTLDVVFSSAVGLTGLDHDKALNTRAWPTSRPTVSRSLLPSSIR